MYVMSEAEKQRYLRYVDLSIRVLAGWAATQRDPSAPEVACWLRDITVHTEFPTDLN
jgi:hypothetical protein